MQLLRWNHSDLNVKVEPFHQNVRACGIRHLVGLVDVVAVQRAEQMLQAGHVVIVDGVDDGLHHKGVFLILVLWRQKKVSFHLSNKDLVSSPRVSEEPRLRCSVCAAQV